MKIHAVLTALALASAAAAVQAQSNEELKSLLDQAMKTIQDLQSRVKALEQGKAAPAVPAGEWGAPVVAPGSKAQDGAPDAGKARAEVYGQAMLDAIYDFRRMNPDRNATMRPSQIPVNCPGDAGCGQNGATILSVRQSSLGVRGFSPTALGMLKTDLSFDLFAADGGTDVHWLNAWAELGPYGAGQTYSLFMDIDVFPNTIDYWGPSGMVFVRNPQLRVTPLARDGMTLSFALEAPNSALDTGKLTAIDPALVGITAWNRAPDVTAALRFDADWGHVMAAGVLREVGYQNPSRADNQPSGHRTGYGLNLAGALNLFGKDKLSWQLVSGRAIASYMNDGGIDLAPDASLRAETVSSLGWLAYYGHTWSDKWTSAIGYSEHRQDNTGGQFGNAFRKGSYASANLLYAPAKNLTTGAEFVWGRHEYKDGSSAPDYRLQFSTKAAF